MHLGYGQWEDFVQGIAGLFYFPPYFFSFFIFVQLPGHKGTVTSVDFHPKEPISTPLFIKFPLAHMLI
jgi:hypothetical protein